MVREISFPIFAGIFCTEIGCEKLTNDKGDFFSAFAGIFTTVNQFTVEKNYSSEDIFSHNSLLFTVLYCRHILQYFTVHITVKYC